MRRTRLVAAMLAIAGLMQTGAAVAAQVGKASYYCCSFAGKLTANGERFNPGAMTAAHKTLPFGTVVRVVHLKTGRSIVVRINDRGPFVGGRIIDLSKGAARQLGFVSSGVAAVRVEVIKMGKGGRKTAAGKKRKSGTNVALNVAPGTRQKGAASSEGTR